MSVLAAAKGSGMMSVSNAARSGVLVEIGFVGTERYNQSYTTFKSKPL